MSAAEKSPAPPVHTPGPWAVTFTSVDGVPYALIRGLDPIAGLRHTDHYTVPVFEANARLIAASPELFDALRRMAAAARSWHDFHCGSDFIDCDSICEVLPAAEAVLAKLEERRR